MAESKEVQALLAEVVAYIRLRAEDYRLGSPQTCSNMFSLARELEGDPVAVPAHPLSWRPGADRG